MLMIPGHKGNANQNPINISLHTLEWLPSRTQTATNAGEDLRKKEPLYTSGEYVNHYNHYGEQYGGYLKN
jgi:hypothetical protein